MGFVQSDFYMPIVVKEFTQITRVDLHLRWNDSAKISKNLKLSTCTSSFMQITSYLEILRNGFCLECGKLSKMLALFQNLNCFRRYGWISNSNLPKLMKTLDFLGFILKLFSEFQDSVSSIPP
jgi:hypothetical protein